MIFRLPILEEIKAGHNHLKSKFIQFAFQEGITISSDPFWIKNDLAQVIIWAQNKPLLDE